MTKPPILTIYIPTYNRYELLREAIESVYGVDVAFMDLFEVVVSDNCSSDATISIGKEIHHANFRYHRNTENIGPERNFYQSARLARGKYVLVLGDDDALGTGFFERIFENLSTGADLVILNYHLYSADMSMAIGTNYSSNRETCFTSRDAVLSEFGPFLGFISGVVFKKELLLATSEADYCRFAEYGFSFLYAIYSGLREPCSVRYVAQPLVKQRCDNSNIPNYTKTFIQGHSVVAEALRVHGFQPKAIRDSLRISVRQFFIPKLVKDLVHDHPVRSQIVEILRLYRCGPLDYGLLCLLYVVPRGPVKFVNSVRKLVRRGHAHSA